MSDFHSLQDRHVFGLGLSRTGTSSLGGALNQLGIRTIHYPYDARTYDELTRGIYRLSILQEYQAIVDIPVAPFYAQLDQAYPGSKFILTVREKSQWLRSVELHWRLMMGWWDRFPEFKKFQTFISACVFGTIDFSPERFAFVYDQHQKNVLDYFAGRDDQLLVMDITAGEGWERLCPFLGRPVSPTKFPHLNEWMHQLALASEEFASTIPLGKTTILVDDMALGGEVGRGYPLVPFLERDGTYWGPPETDDVAIDALDRLHRAGASHLVFGWPSFWWLDCYPRFSAHIRSRYPCVLQNARLIIFRLEANAC